MENFNLGIAKLSVFLKTSLSIILFTGHPALINATKNDELEEVEILLKRGCDVNKREDNSFGYTPLHWASQKGYLDIVKFLVEEGRADLKKKDNKDLTCLFRAAQHNHLSVVEYLGEKEPSLIDEAGGEGRTPLWNTCYNGYNDIVKYLIASGANVESKGASFLVTPLMIATQQGQFATVKILIEEGDAEIDNKDSNGRTALFHGAINNQRIIMEYLLQKGANIDEPNNSNYTALHIACNIGTRRIVRFLLENGADVNTSTNFGWTPLVTAANNGRLDLVKILVEEGKADVNEKALELAQDRAHEEIFEYLKRSQSNSNKPFRQSF